MNGVRQLLILISITTSLVFVEPAKGDSLVYSCSAAVTYSVTTNVRNSFGGYSLRTTYYTKNYRFSIDRNYGTMNVEYGTGVTAPNQKGPYQRTTYKDASGVATAYSYTVSSLEGGYIGIKRFVMADGITPSAATQVIGHASGNISVSTSYPTVVNCQ